MWPVAICLFLSATSYLCSALVQDYNPTLDAQESLEDLKALGLASEAVGNPAYHQKNGYSPPNGINQPGAVADSARGVGANGMVTPNPAYANGNGAARNVV